MCQLKNHGSRCFTHSNGTKGVVKQAILATKATEKDVRGVLSDLRKEGSKLDAPTAKQVAAFAELQRFQVKNDENISAHDKKIIMNQWERSKEETPNGGAFHAWKHGVAETMRRVRASGMAKKAMTFGAIGTLSFSLAGCGGSLDNETPTPNTSPSNSVSEPAVPVETDEAVPNSPGIIEGEETNDGLGSYTKITLADDSPLLTYDPAQVDEAAKAKFTEQEITEAQGLVSRFVIEEGVDSNLAYNTAANIPQWIAENSGDFTPDAAADFSGESLNAVVSDNESGWRGTPVYTAGSPRVTDVNFKIESITLDEGSQSLDFRYTGSFNHKVTNPTDATDTKVYTEKNAPSVLMRVEKDATSGKWLISGWSNTWDGNVVQE